MALKPERQLTDTIIRYSLLESSGNAGAAVVISSASKVKLAPSGTVGADVLGILLQDVRPSDYTNRPERLVDSTCVSGEVVGIMTRGIVITDQVTGTVCAGSGISVSTAGAGAMINRTVESGTLVFGTVLAASGDLGMSGYTQIKVEC